MVMESSTESVASTAQSPSQGAGGHASTDEGPMMEDLSADLSVPPLPPTLAHELYGHFAEPISGSSPAEIDAQSLARRNAIVETVGTHAATVESKASESKAVAQDRARGEVAAKHSDVPPQPAGTAPTAESRPPEKPIPPTREGLAAELDASLAKEERELDDDKAKALADLDARIDAAKAKMDGAQLGDKAVDDATGQVDAVAKGQSAAIVKRETDAIAAQSKQAETDAAGVIAVAEGAAVKFVADAIVVATQTMNTAIAAGNRFNTDAAAAADIKRSSAPAGDIIALARAQVEATAITADGAAKAKNAIDAARAAFTAAVGRANDEAKHIRQEAATTAARMKGDATFSAVKAGVGGVVNVDNSRKAGDEKIKADAEGGRAKQKEREDKTLADLQKQRADLVTRLDTQIAGKKKELQTRIASAHKQVAAAKDDPGALNRLAASVKATTGQIDKVSDQVEQSATAQVGMIARRLDMETAQTLAVMKLQGQQALRQIDADVKAAKAAVEKTGKEAGGLQEQAEHDFAGREKKALDDLKASARRRDQQLETGRQESLENAEIQSLDVKDRELRRKEIAGRHELKAAADPQSLLNALAKFPPAKRQAALDGLSDAQKKGLAELDKHNAAAGRPPLDLLAMANDVDKIQALEIARDASGTLLAGQQGRLERALEGKSLEERNAILAAAGNGLGTALTDEEKAAKVKLIAEATKGGKLDQAKVMAAMGDMTPDQARQFAEAYEKETRHKLSADVPAEMIPENALDKDALATKKKNGEGWGKVSGARSGNPDKDLAQMRAGLAEMDEQHREAAIANLPEGMKGLGKQLLAAQKDADELRKHADDPGAQEALLKKLPPAERINALKAAGIEGQLADSYGRLNDAEADAMVKGLGAGKDGKVDPARLKAAFVGLDGEGLKELGERFEKSTSVKLEKALPPELVGMLPNAVLTPEAIAGKLKERLKDPHARGQAFHDWAASLPDDQRDAAIAQLSPEEQHAARAAVKGIEVGEKLRTFNQSIDAGEAAVHAASGGNKQIDAGFGKGMKGMRDGYLAAQMAVLTPEERAAVAQDGVDIGTFAQLNETELQERRERVTAAMTHSKSGKSDAVKRIFGDLSPEQAQQVAEACVTDHEKRLEDVFDARDLPSGALTLATQLREKRADLYTGGGSSAKDPRAQQAFYDNIKDLSDEDRTRAVAQMPPEMQRQAATMMSMKEDLDELRAITAGGTVDPAVIERVMAGRPQSERKALLDVSGIADKIPGAARYGELSKEEKEAAALQLKCAIGTDDKGNKVVDEASAAYVWKHVDADQAGKIKWAFNDLTGGTQLGDYFAGHEDAIPAALRVKTVDLTNKEQKKKIDDDVDTLFRALDHGCDEDSIINTLRGKSRSEISAVLSEYKARKGGVDLEKLLREKLADSDEALGAVDALLSNDPVRATVESLKYAKRGHGADGTNEDLMKSTLEGITDPEERARVIADYNKWAIANDELTIHAMLKDELGQNDNEECQALLAGNAAQVRAARAYEAMDGSNNIKKLKEQIEACPDAKSRRELAEAFKEIAAARGDAIQDFDSYMGSQLDDKEYKSLGKLQKGDVEGAYAAEIEIGDRKDMFKAYEKKPPGFHGSDKQWRDRLTKAHDEDAIKHGRPTMQQLVDGDEFSDEEVARGKRNWDGDSLNDMDRQRLREDLIQGHMDPITAVEYGASKHGDDSDCAVALKRSDGSYRSKEEIAALERDWNPSRHGGQSLKEFLVDKLGGNDEFDALDALQGEPADNDERIARLEAKNTHEHSGLLKGVTNWFTDADEMADARLREAKRAAEDVKKYWDDPEKLAAAQDRLHEASSAMDASIGDHRVAQEQIAATVAQVMKWGSIAASVLFPLPGMQYLAMAMQSTALNKKALLGDAMSGKQLARELAVEAPEAIINALVTIGTLGTGTAEVVVLEQGLKETLLQTVGKMALSGAKAFGSNMVMGALTTLPSEIQGLVSGEKSLGDLTGDLLINSLLGTLTHGLGGGMAAGAAGLAEKKIMEKGRAELLAKVLTGLGDVGIQTLVGPLLRGEAVDANAIFAAVQAASGHVSSIGDPGGPTQGEKFLSWLKGEGEHHGEPVAHHAAPPETTGTHVAPEPQTGRETVLPPAPHETAPPAPQPHETAPAPQPQPHETAPAPQPQPHETAPAPQPQPHETAPPAAHEPEPVRRRDPELETQVAKRLEEQREALDGIVDDEQRAAAEKRLAATEKLGDAELQQKALDLARSEAAFPERMEALDKALANGDPVALRETMDKLGKAKEIGLEQDYHRANEKALAAANDKLTEVKAALEKVKQLKAAGASIEAQTLAENQLANARGKVELKPAEVQAILDDAVGQARQHALQQLKGVDPKQALLPENQGGNCGPSQHVVVSALEAMGGEVTRLSTDTVGGGALANTGKGSDHFATLVRMPDGKVYLVDPMFGQFLQDSVPEGKQAGHVGRNMLEMKGGEALARSLANDGHIELTDEVAAIYGSAMSGREGKYTTDDLLSAGGKDAHGGFARNVKENVGEAQPGYLASHEPRPDAPDGPAVKPAKPIGYTHPGGEPIFPGEKPGGPWTDPDGNRHGSDGTLLETRKEAEDRDARSRVGPEYKKGQAQALEELRADPANHGVPISELRRRAGEMAMDGMARSPDEVAYHGEVKAKAEALRERFPDLDAGEIDRRARNEVLHGMNDGAPGKIAAAADAVSAALSAGDGAAALDAFGEIHDLSERRNLMKKLRDESGGASLEQMMARLPADQQAQVRAKLESLRAAPDQIAATGELIKAQDAARKHYQELCAAGGTSPEALARIDAAGAALKRTTQAAMDAVIDTYGIDDGQMRQRRPTERMGYGIDRGDITVEAGGGSGQAVALPDGRVIAPSAAEGLFYDDATGQLRDPGLVGAMLGHEVEAHTEQLRERRFTKNARLGADVGTAINEVEAYDGMLRDAGRYGLSEADQRQIRARRDQYLEEIRAAGGPYEQVKAGDYGVGDLEVHETEVAPWTAHGGEPIAPAPDGQGDGFDDGKWVNLKKRADQAEKRPPGVNAKQAAELEQQGYTWEKRGDRRVLVAPDGGEKMTLDAHGNFLNEEQAALAEQAKKRPASADPARAAELEEEGYRWQKRGNDLCLVSDDGGTVLTPDAQGHLVARSGDKPIHFDATPAGGKGHIRAEDIPREPSHGDKVSVQEGMDGQVARREHWRKAEGEAQARFNDALAHDPLIDPDARKHYLEELAKDPGSDATRAAREKLGAGGTASQLAGETLDRCQRFTNDASRRVGEGAAIIAMRERAKAMGLKAEDVKIIYGGWDHASTNGDLDMVFELNGRLYVIEAKGGTSPLGAADIKEGPNAGKRARQGSKEYLGHIVTEMEKRAKNTIDELGRLGVRTPEQAKALADAYATRDTASRVRQAFASGTLDYESVRARFGPDDRKRDPRIVPPDPFAESAGGEPRFVEEAGGHQKLAEIVTQGYDISGGSPWEM